MTFTELKKKINNFSYRFKWNYGKHLYLKKPVCVDLELSSACNLKCNFCYHADKPPFEKGFMDYELATCILAQVAHLEIPSIKLSGRGESVLNKDFHAISYLAKYYSFQDIIINTNLNFNPLRRDILAGLLRCTTIKVSLDTLNESTYNKIRIGGNFRNVIGNLNILHGRLTDQRLVLQFVRTEENKDENFKRVKTLWPKAEVVIKDMVGGRNQDSVAPTNKRKCCMQPFVRLIARFNGDVVLCCPDFKDEYVIGNIKDMTIKEMFNSKKARLLRKSLKSGKAFSHEPCKSCSSYESYEGWKGSWKS